MSIPPSLSTELDCKPDFCESLRGFTPVRADAHRSPAGAVPPPQRRVRAAAHRRRPRRNAKERWMDVTFQVQSFVDSLQGVEFLGETFPVFWPNLSAVVYNLFLGQAADFDNMTAWHIPASTIWKDLPPLARRVGRRILPDHRGPRRAGLRIGRRTLPGGLHRHVCGNRLRGWPWRHGADVPRPGD